MSNFLQVTDITGIKVGDTVMFRDGRTDVVVGVGKFGYLIVQMRLKMHFNASRLHKRQIILHLIQHFGMES